MKENKRRVGAFYEQMAADYLVSQGVMILDRNYRNRQGEIDLIGMTADNWLIFVEVKYRSTKCSGSPLAAVNAHKQRIISRVAVEYLKNRYKSMDVRCRFDVVGIEGDNICWIRNAFDFCS
nr:YraN family protein [uncultured Blautia sp.]